MLVIQFIRTAYTPYGSATADGDVAQSIQWSSEYHDTELGLVYYKTSDGCKADSNGGFNASAGWGISF